MLRESTPGGAQHTKCRSWGGSQKEAFACFDEGEIDERRRCDESKVDCWQRHKAQWARKRAERQKNAYGHYDQRG